jgi:hypothetical protein
LLFITAHPIAVHNGCIGDTMGAIIFDRPRRREVAFGHGAGDELFLEPPILRNGGINEIFPKASPARFSGRISGLSCCYQTGWTNDVGRLVDGLPEWRAAGLPVIAGGF